MGMRGRKEYRRGSEEVKKTDGKEGMQEERANAKGGGGNEKGDQREEEEEEE